MKKFLTFIFSLLLCVGISGGAFLIAKRIDANSKAEQSDTSSGGSNTDEGSSEVGDTDSGNTDSDDTDEEDNAGGLNVPANEGSLIAEGLEMQKGAMLSLTEGDRAMRFTCDISKELYDAVQADDNKELAMLVMPTKYFDKVNTNGYTYIDWIKAFDEAGETTYSYLVYDDLIGTTDSGYYMRYKLSGIPYSGINMNITCLGVLKTTNADGSVDYKYAVLPSGETYQSNARSMAYLAAATLNAHTLGAESLTDAQITMLKGFINESVDKANGLTAATDDNSTYAFITNPSAPKTISVGESFTVTVEVTPDVNVPVWYRSTDDSVVTVDDNGNVVARKAGTAVIGVYVAGEAVGITVTVV